MMQCALQLQLFALRVDHSSNFSISFAKPLAGPSWLSDPFNFVDEDDEQQQPPSPTNLLSARDNDCPANALAKVLVSTYKTCQRIGLQYPKPPPSPVPDASKSPPVAAKASDRGTKPSSPGIPTSLTLTLPPFSPLTSPMRPKPKSRKRKRRPMRPSNRFQPRMKMKSESSPQKTGEPARSNGVAKKTKMPILGRVSNVHA